MMFHQLPKNILIIGGGEGATLREMIKHPSVESIIMVDIDKNLIDICKEYLPNHHQGSFDDSRVNIVIDDAFKFVENTSDKFDVIIVDVPDPLEFGPAHHLFTLEFYEKISTILKNLDIHLRSTPHSIIMSSGLWNPPNELEEELKIIGAKCEFIQSIHID